MAISSSTRRRPAPPARSVRGCALCRDHAEWVDYKDVALLSRFVSARGKIRARRASGACARHQAEIATAIKTARELVLLPYEVPTSTASRTGRPARARGAAGAGTERTTVTPGLRPAIEEA